MKYRVAVIAAPILILAACEPGNNDPGSAEECIEAFAAADGYGYEQDGYDCAQPPPGDDDDDDLGGIGGGGGSGVRPTDGETVTLGQQEGSDLGCGG